MMYEKENYIDLYIHTTASDGKLTINEMIRDAKDAGLSAIAITDHNCFALREPLLYQGMEVIPGVESSTIYPYDGGLKKEVHVLGYFFHGIDPALEVVFGQIDKNPYVHALIKLLNSLGLPVTMEELRELYPNTKQFGRYNIAELLVKKGFANTAPEAMDRWIGNFSPHYLNPADYVNFISIEEWIGLLCNCSVPVMPVLAHPYHYGFNEEQIETLVAYVRSLTDHPLGLEVYYGKYQDDQIRFLEKLADKYGYFPSAGGDRHRSEQPFVHGGYCLLEAMKKAVKA